MEAITTKKEVKSPLINKKVKVVLITDRTGGWLPKGHDGAQMFTGSKLTLDVPLNSTGLLVDPLTNEERAYFESPYSGLALNPGDLSIYKKKDNFWHSFRVSIDKNGLILNLNEPLDYIKYKVLKVNTQVIAKSYSERLNKASYKFYLSEEDEEFSIKRNKADFTQKAWTAYGEMKNSRDKLAAFLRIYKGLRVGADSKLEFLQSQVADIITDETKKFVETIEDDSYETKVLVYKGLDCGVIIQLSKTVYEVPVLDVKFNSLKELVSYLESAANSENFLKIKGLIEKAQKSK